MENDFRDRPSMLDQYGGRIPLYPASVHGKWRTRRNWVHFVLMIAFLILPWVQVNGAPALLLDVSNHRLAFFGLKFWAHDSPILFLVLASFAIALALVTALWGRAWCGWACPQTVFLDAVFRRIEFWTEGSHLQRRARDAAPATVGSLARKTLKWILYFVFSVVLTHSLLAYFFGADRVLTMVRSSPSENLGAFFFILLVNGLLLFDMSWFREQFCLIVCPYGRIQSVLMDSNTVAVQYDHQRGEPRKLKSTSPGKNGACISCNRCVSVCPTGIDIRNGIQLECISCTACIDACDDVMRKIRQPEGLIRHRAETDKPVRWLRSRILLYSALLLLLLMGLFTAVQFHRPVEVVMLRALGTPYFEQTDASGKILIVNSYRMHIHNQSDDLQKIHIALEDAPIGSHLKIPEALLEVGTGDSRMIPFIVEIPKESLRDIENLNLKIKVQNEIQEVQFVIPRS